MYVHVHMKEEERDDVCTNVHVHKAVALTIVGWVHRLCILCCPEHGASEKCMLKVVSLSLSVWY